MLLGIIVLSAVAHQTLSTGENPFEAMRTHAGAFFAYGWAIAAILSSIIWQFAQYMKERFEEAGYENFGIRADSAVSLNRRARQAIVAADTNLLSVKLGLHNDWIVPLQEPLPRPNLASQ